MHPNKRPRDQVDRNREPSHKEDSDRDSEPKGKKQKNNEDYYPSVEMETLNLIIPALYKSRIGSSKNVQ